MIPFVKEFEDFVLSNKNPDSLKNIIPGLEQDYFIRIYTALNALEVTSKKAEIDKIQTLINDTTYKHNKDFSSAKLMLLLKEFDLKETSNDRKKSIIQEIKSLVGVHINFSSRPANITKNMRSSSDSNQLPSELDLDEYDPEKFFQNLVKSKYMSSDSLDFFGDFVNLADLEDSSWEMILIKGYNNNFPFGKLSEAALKKMSAFIDRYSNEKKCSVNISQFLLQMTVHQLEVLIDSITNIYFDQNILLNEIISKKYYSQYGEVSDEPEKAYDLQLEILKFVEGRDKKFNQLRYEVLLNLLSLGETLNRYDLNLFKEYVKQPKSQDQGIYNLKKKEIARSQRYNVCSQGNLSSSQESSIVDKYLKHFFLHESIPLSEFKELFNPKYIERIHMIARILQGEDIQNFSFTLSQSQYEETIKSTLLTICKHNKSNFAVNEKVVLEVEVKNVQTMFLKIFEVNTENYYLSKKSSINSNISLDGLISTFEETYSFNEKPQKLVKRRIELDMISKRRGLFIVELIGNGLSSRAIIKIGGLSTVSRPSTFGKLFFILNEAGEILKKSDHRGIWFKDTFYKSTSEDGVVVIPYMKSLTRDKAIIVDDGFAELAEIEIPDENYSLKGAFYFCHEAMMMGNTAAVLFRPLLLVNNRITSVTKLKNPKITINIVKVDNHTDIPINNMIENLELNDASEVKFEVQVPPKLKSLTFTFEAEISNKSKGSNDKLSFSKNYRFDLDKEDQELAKMYLKNCDGNYFLYALGKNGEPLVETQIDVNPGVHKFLSVRFGSRCLMTDSEGKVDLKNIGDYFRSFQAVLRHRIAVTQSFNLDAYARDYSYPQTIDILDNETFTLPLTRANATDKYTLDFYVALFKVNAQQSRIQDLLLNDESKDKISYKAHSDTSSSGLLTISNLSPGTYKLHFRQLNHTVTIVSHVGKHWGFKNFIEKRNCIVENSEYRNPIRIEQAALKKEDGKSVLRVKINNDHRNGRVHVFAFQFLDHFNTILDTINSNLSAMTTHSYHSFQNWKNIYVSDKRLSDEMQYVLDRKQQERFLGNTLEKPSLLVKRQFVRNTTTDMEQLAEGTEFQNVQANALKSMQRPMEYASQMQRRSNSCLMNNLSCFHNFLGDSPLSYENLHPDKDGLIEVKDDQLDHYQHIYVLAIDERSCSQELVANPRRVIKCRSLTLASILDSDKNFTELRLVDNFHPEEKIVISDIASTAFKLMDSLDSFISFNCLLSPHLSGQWEKFKFLLKLNQLKEEELLQKISAFYSHELNVYLYFKHPELFTQHILPTLKFKAEKTFIDFFLLNDQQNLARFLDPIRISTLNPFEKCLLVLATHKGNSDLCQSIGKNMAGEANSTKVLPQELKRIFNIVMNMKVDQGEVDKPRAFIQPASMNVNRVQAESEFNMRGMIESNCFDMAQCQMNRGAILEQNCFDDDASFGGLEMEEECASYGDRFENCEQNFNDNYNNLQNARNNQFKEPGESQEFCETHFYNTVNKGVYFQNKIFWADLCKHFLAANSAKGFVSKNILCVFENISELIFAMAVLDLPSKAMSHDFTKKEGRSLEIHCKSNVLLFTKEIRETSSKLNSNLAIAQNIVEYDKSDHESDDALTELLVGRIYTLETVVTNISTQRLQFELLVQVPQGAIPAYNSDYIQAFNHSLDKFNTNNFKVHFYFPAVGSYSQFAPTISIEGLVVAKAEPTTYQVIDKVTVVKSETIDSVLETGSKEDLMKFFEAKKDISHNDIRKVLWLMEDLKFYNHIMSILRQRGIYLEEVWAFGFHHRDEQTCSEYMHHSQAFRRKVGGPFKSSLLTIDQADLFDIDRHLDYDPVLNARVHKLGQENSILNKELRQTYEEFIMKMIRLDDFSPRNLLRLTYYLILQDRVDEAVSVFSAVDVRSLQHDLCIQYDYVAAYLDFSNGYPEFSLASQICNKYKNFPLEHWRELFEEIEDQLIQFAGKEVEGDIDSIINEERKKKQKAKHVEKAEPRLSFTIDNKTLQIVHQNVPHVTIKFYQIDLEILFSRNPFIKSNSDEFSFVQPNFVHRQDLSVATLKEELFNFTIPEDFQAKNLFIEVSSTDKKRFDTYFSTSIKVTISETIGEVKLTDSKLNLITKAYVKCFAQMKDGSVKFYKDGYTDLRGRFNYVQLNTNQISQVSKFALLLIDDNLGSVIRECNPPANLKVEQGESEFESYVNMRQQVKNAWRSKNKKK